MNTEASYSNEIEILVNLFTIDNGELKVLLVRREMDPYRGYWMLPTGLILSNETVEECLRETLYEWFRLKDVNLELSNIYSDINRIPVERVIGCSYYGIINIDLFNMQKKNIKEEYAWFPITEIPKIVYDHEEIIKDSTKNIRKKLKQFSFMKNLFPSDFTLSELQSSYENIFNTSLDRRNFRKKIASLNILEDTEYKNEDTNGRPAALYRFKEEIDDELVF